MSHEQRTPAFPARIRDDDGVVWPAFGLTKLEYAAIQIMAGLCADPNVTADRKFVAEAAVCAARTLFAELEKSE